MRSNTNRKKIAPVIITVIVLLYVGPLVGILLAALAGLAEIGAGEVIPLLLMYVVLGGAVVVGILMALAQRLKEIDGGEEEDAKKY